MTNPSQARFARILEIRNLQRTVAQASLARANQHAAEAERLAREVEARLDETARRAVLSGELAIDDFVEARVRVTRLAVERDRATEAQLAAETQAAVKRRELERASVAMRQAESLCENGARAANVEEVARDRKLSDEVAARRAGAAA